MRNNILLTGLGMAAIVMVLIIAAGLTVNDGNPPQITFQEETIMYRDGEEPDVLLKDVSAVDEEDGDVSDSLIVKNLYRVSDKYGIAVFAAKDSNNNVTVVSRGFSYADDPDADEKPEDGDEPSEGEPEDEDKPGDGDKPEDGDEPEDGDKPEDEDEPEDGEEPEDGDAHDPESDENGINYARLKEENTKAGIPYLKLSQYEVTLSKGSSFIIQKYIEEALEGKDGAGGDAMRHLRVDNKPDMNVPGVYEAIVYVRDNSGNVSNKEVLKVTVE